jgi:hypothetical protein
MLTRLMTRAFPAAPALLVAALTAAAEPVFAQTSDSDLPSIGAIRTPTSPAFTLLGVEPTSIERPSTPADLAFNLINQARSGLSVPKDFAAEVSPYWLTNHTNLRWQDDVDRSLLQSIARTTTFSMATSTNEDTNTTGLGLGARVGIFSGSLTPETRRALDDRASLFDQQNAKFLARLYENGLGNLDRMLADGKLSLADYDLAKRELAERVLQSAEFQQMRKSITDLVVTREGFTLDFATALTWDFAGADWKDREFRKWGVWLTPGWQSAPFSALGVLRYIKDRQVSDETDALEVGARGLYATARSTLSIEYLKRSIRDSDVDGEFRLVGVAEYRLSTGTWVTASFGRDRQRADSRGSLVAQLGLSLNLSEDRYKIE